MESEHHWMRSLGLPSDGKTRLKRANPVKGPGNWKEKAELKSLADTFGVRFFPTRLDVGWEEGFFPPSERADLCFLRFCL